MSKRDTDLQGQNTDANRITHKQNPNAPIPYCPNTTNMCKQENDQRTLIHKQVVNSNVPRDEMYDGVHSLAETCNQLYLGVGVCHSPDVGQQSQSVKHRQFQVFTDEKSIHLIIFIKRFKNILLST